MSDSLAHAAEQQVHDGRLSQRSLGREIASRLRREIILRNVEPGTVLVQDQLCEIYDVSRMPVRDALVTLANEGFVERTRRNQMVVSEFTAKDLLDTFHVEAVVCGLTARRAASHATEEDLDELEALLRAADRSDDPATHARVTWEFHRRINKLAHSTRLLAALRAVSVAFVQDFTRDLPDWWETGHAEHREIFEALRARDRDAAERLMFAHFNHAGRRLLTLLRERGVLVDDSDDGESSSASRAHGQGRREGDGRRRSDGQR